jgi:hypothetical protein
MSYALKVRYTGTLQQSIYYVRDTTACTHAVVITFRYVITIPVEALVLVGNQFFDSYFRDPDQVSACYHTVIITESLSSWSFKTPVRISAVLIGLRVQVGLCSMLQCLSILLEPLLGPQRYVWCGMIVEHDRTILHPSWSFLTNLLSLLNVLQ